MNFPYIDFYLEVVRGSAKYASAGCGEDHYHVTFYGAQNGVPWRPIHRVEFLHAPSGPREAVVEALRQVVARGTSAFDGAALEYAKRRYEAEREAFSKRVFEAIRALIGPENVYVYSVWAGTSSLCDGRMVRFSHTAPTTEAWSVTDGPSGLSAKGLLDYLAK